MVGVVVCIYKLFLAFVQAVWLYFTEYIEIADAIMSGLIIRSYILDWGMSSMVANVIGVAAGILFLIIFRTSKIGWCIMTVVFSFGWAGFIADVVKDIIDIHAILYWIIVAGLTAYFAWLHHYVLHRAEAHKLELEEEYAKKHPNKEKPLSAAELKNIQDILNVTFEKK